MSMRERDGGDTGSRVSLGALLLIAAIGLGGAALGAAASPRFAAMAAAPLAMMAFMAAIGWRNEIATGILIIAHVAFAGFLGWSAGAPSAAYTVWALVPLVSGIASRGAWNPAAVLGAVPFAIIPFVPLMETSGAALATAPFSALAFCAYSVLSAITAVWRRGERDTSEDIRLARLDFLEACMEQVIIRLDTRGIVRDVAGRPDRLFGLTRSEMIGRPITDHVNEADVDTLAAIVSGAAYDDIQESCECAPRADPDRRLRLVARLMPRNSPEDPFEVVLTAGDAQYPADYERRLDDAIERAERAEAQRDDFVQEVSHDVRSPLNAVIGFAELMRRNTFGPLGNKQYETHIAMIHESGQDVLDLVNDAERASGIRSGTRMLVIESVDLTELLTQVVDRLRARASRKGVRLQLDVPDTPLQAQIDRDATRQVLRMAARAALRDSRPNGRVRLSARREENQILLRIEDDGAGYAEHEIRLALSGGQAAGAPRLGAEFGECRTIASRLNASLSLESAPGRGTTLGVSLPAVPQNSAQAASVAQMPRKA